jgi:hypothetical protein
MGGSDKTHFSALNENEKQSKCWQLEKSKSLVTIWYKGESLKYQFMARLLNKDDGYLFLRGDSAPIKTKSEVLGSFDINGVNYFFQTEALLHTKDEIKISLKGQFFKLERRNHFRLMAYPIYKIYFESHISARYKGSNVIHLHTKTTQTGLFKNFLKLVDRSSGENDALESKIKLRVQDLSIHGMSIHIGSAELPFFKPDQVLKNIKIVFPDESIEIPMAKIVYVIDVLSSGEKSVKTFKMGLQFEGISAVLDDQLSRKLNKLLREVDSNKDFEDYLS